MGLKPLSKIDIGGTLLKTSIVGGGKEMLEELNFFREGFVSSGAEALLAPFLPFAALGIDEAMSIEHNDVR